MTQDECRTVVQSLTEDPSMEAVYQAGDEFPCQIWRVFVRARTWEEAVQQLMNQISPEFLNKEKQSG